MAAVEWRKPKSVELILDESTSRESTIKALKEREEAIADFLRLAGMTFGLYPEVVAEVLAQSGLGLELTAEQREYVHSNYINLINRLAEENGQQ